MAKNFTLRAKRPVPTAPFACVRDGPNSSVLVEIPVTVHIHENITSLSRVRERHDAIHSMDMKLQLAALR